MPICSFNFLFDSQQSQAKRTCLGCRTSASQPPSTWESKGTRWRWWRLKALTSFKPCMILLMSTWVRPSHSFSPWTNLPKTTTSLHHQGSPPNPSSPPPSCITPTPRPPSPALYPPLRRPNSNGPCNKPDPSGHHHKHNITCSRYLFFLELSRTICSRYIRCRVFQVEPDVECREAKPTRVIPLREDHAVKNYNSS